MKIGYIKFFILVSSVVSPLIYADDITIPRPVGYLGFGPEAFIIMDRNLGATSNDINLPESYGLYFQRGNNHGLPATAPRINKRAKWNDSYAHKGYYGGNAFLEPGGGVDDNGDYREEQTINNELRGGENDKLENYFGLDDILETQGNRQGPCPDGYHIPSIGEWIKLLEYWCSNHKDICSLKNFKHNICKNHEFGEYCITPTDFRLHNFNIGKTFSEELKIPLEAFRGESTWTGETTRLLSSSPTSPGVYLLDIIDMNLDLDYIDIISLPRTVPVNIRCFKNYDNPLTTHMPTKIFYLPVVWMVFVMLGA